MDDRNADRDHRVLVFAPIGRDGALTDELLRRASIDCLVCGSVGQVVDELADGAGAVILTEEALDDRGFANLPNALERQAAWSDIPIILFAGSAQTSASLRTIGLAEALRNVTFIDRPIRVAAVISVVRAALRARRRQYELRDTLVALHAARNEAETASRLKDEFLATLSHELRTPLNAILGWTALLRNGGVDPGRVPRALEVVDRNARAQAQLVEDVLDMSRIITGKLRVEFAPVSLAAVIDAAVESVGPAADAKQIRLVVTSASRVSDIRGDADRLQQVFWNLLSNAIKFTPEGGEVRVEVGADAYQVTISITDTGVGLPQEFLPYVFDRFRQADQSVTRGHGGLGLGLAIVKHLVEQHGGHVDVASEGVGKGATFRVVLPIPRTLETVPISADDEREAFGIRLCGRQVLVVDDDESTRELLVELFRRTDATVVTAGSAVAAFEVVLRQPPDLIIADVGMPGEDGNSLMRRIRAIPPPIGQVPAIALSAYTRAQDRAAAKAAGFTEFMGKPAPPHSLLRAVQRLLGASRPDATL
jgi:signal transduction histidine kinase/CheY-like chemotaxis protein